MNGVNSNNTNNEQLIDLVVGSINDQENHEAIFEMSGKVVESGVATNITGIPKGQLLSAINLAKERLESGDVSEDEVLNVASQNLSSNLKMG